MRATTLQPRSRTLPANNRDEQQDSQLVWNLPTRVFHWLLVLCISAMLVTGLSDNLDWMEWHQKIGYVLLGLLIFRIFWGIFGQDYGRFSRFPLHPKSVVGYLRNKHSALGHNPLGALSVVAMLLAIATQVISGLMTSDGFYVEGPWVYWADDNWVDVAGSVHDFNWMVIAALISLHISAVVYHQWIKKHPLIKPMVTGYTKTPPATSETTATPVAPLKAMLMVVASGLLAWGMITIPG